MIESIFNNDGFGFVTGASTHNVHIERLWQNVYRCVGVVYYEILYDLEDRGCFNRLNGCSVYSTGVCLLTPYQ